MAPLTECVALFNDGSRVTRGATGAEIFHRQLNNGLRRTRHPQKRDRSGAEVPSGYYFAKLVYRLCAERFTLSTSSLSFRIYSCHFGGSSYTSVKLFAVAVTRWIHSAIGCRSSCSHVWRYGCLKGSDTWILFMHRTVRQWVADCVFYSSSLCFIYYCNGGCGLSVLCNKEYDDDDDDDDDDDYVNTHTRFQCELQNVNVAWILTLIPARRGGVKLTPLRILPKIAYQAMEWDSCFCDIVRDPLAFRRNWVYHYICFQFYVAGLDLRSTWLVLRLPALYACEAKIYTSQMWDFWILETENGKITRQEYKERYLYIFKTTDKTWSSISSIRSSARTHSHSHSRINLK